MISAKLGLLLPSICQLLSQRTPIVERHQLFAVHRTQVDVLLPEQGIAVLNADEEISFEIAKINPGKELIYFSLNSESNVIKNHLQAGHKAVVAHTDAIHLYQGTIQTYRISLNDIAYLQAQKNSKRMMELLASIAALWAIDVPLETIETGLEAYLPESLEV
jgi:cyanophycin synthetase